ncbi:RNA-splicing factor [Didymella heteroderae]|uniref:Pre-mRNA-splicing factor CWC24 n=1 Tax=Didymella heteroderae TaxID=1769908 RepID=A0A9P4WIW3_9PLEO|nr:RNA-splicing factor [Didymella heteroderae]
MADAPVVKFKKRGAKAAPRKVAPPPPLDSDDSSSGSEAENEDGRVVKRRKTTSSALKASTADHKPSTAGLEGTTQYAANRSATIEASSDATKQSNWFEGDSALNAKELLGSTRSAPNPSLSSKPTSFIDRNPDAPPKFVGPQKSSSNVRTITVTDYTPDVCKDYKQTGFCGFGDNCKFLHAREDYAAGWKLDREWEMSTKGKKPGGTIVASANRDDKEKDEDGVDLAMLEKIPFACIICKKPYKSPIVTKCGHYFCEACALKRYRKDPTCAACNAKTYGVFNGAKNLQRLLEKKQKWEDKKKAEAEAEEKENEDS